MNEICVNIITRSELRGHQNLINILNVYQKKRKTFKFDKYAFCEPIKESFAVEVIPEIVSKDKFNILLRDSMHAVTGSIWMNNRIKTIFLECKKWNTQMANDLWDLTKEISQVVEVDFAFLDILTERVVQGGKKIGAILKTHRDKENYTYSLFPKNLSFGLPDAYHFMLIDKKMVTAIFDLIEKLKTVCLVSVSENYIECLLSEELGSNEEEIKNKKDLIFGIISQRFKSDEWGLSLQDKPN